ncbi:MAG: galactokinase [Clostridia bacterium]|nr:galactokinase [Clostridia bacterium]
MLRRTYREVRLAEAQKRLCAAAEDFYHAFGSEPEAFFSAPGRTELGGNHTDHQHGCVLAASVDLDLIAAAAPNHSGVIRICSEGYAPITVALDDLAIKPEEHGSSAALVRGVAEGFRRRGFVFADRGLDAYITSNLPGGSGLSSSAAFEVLMVTMLDHLFFGGNLPAAELAKIGQFAENEYFGKPCGLMDQFACAMGGAVAIDFADPDAPKAESIPVDLSSFGYALCILDCGADHADLTHEYAAITEELAAVCRYFGKRYLREVDEADFLSALPALRRNAGDRAVLRAMHVYEENRRAQSEARALKERDFSRFLSLAQASGRSSLAYLQNITPCGQTAQQELLFAIALCEKLLGGQGAVRVHGGGFGGTVQAYVPLAAVKAFCEQAEAVLGQGSCRILSLRPIGAVRLV